MEEHDIDDRALTPEDLGDEAGRSVAAGACPECLGAGVLPDGEECPVCEGTGKANGRVGGG